jgi:hypothetical protein
LGERESDEPTRAQKRAAGMKKTALFDIVNRKETPIGIGVEPTGRRV